MYYIDRKLIDLFQWFSECSQVKWNGGNCYWWAFFMAQVSLGLVVLSIIFWLPQAQSFDMAILVVVMVISLVGDGVLLYMRLPRLQKLSRLQYPSRDALQLTTFPIWRLFNLVTGSLFLLSGVMGGTPVWMFVTTGSVFCTTVMIEYFLLCLPLPPDAVAQRKTLAKASALPQAT